MRWVVVGVLVVVFATGAWLLHENFAARRRADELRVLTEVLPDVAQRIQNFHRVKVEGGRKVWEVSAREARYLEPEQLVVVDAPQLEVFLPDGRTVALRGTTGRVYLEKRELDRVELEGEIEVQMGEYALHTANARYEARRGIIVAPGDVRITADTLELHGRAMEVDVRAQQLVLGAGVQTTLWPRS